METKAELVTRIETIRARKDFAIATGYPASESIRSERSYFRFFVQNPKFQRRRKKNKKKKKPREISARDIIAFICDYGADEARKQDRSVSLLNSTVYKSCAHRHC